MKRGVKTSSKTSGAIRVISGRFRGRKLPVLDVQGLRPTTDKNKETLFNWLAPFIRNTSCLDLFAGSGGLGFEALSRYAKQCTFVELDKHAVKNLLLNIQLLQLPTEQAQVIQGNAVEKLNQIEDTFDLIFLDPPFNQDLLPHVIEIISKKQLLAADGLIYIECESVGGGYIVPESWRLIKEKCTLQILTRLYQRNG
jgi:16S rRNA (guanine966-N2)-methyltransferase